jgi:hypothetical protein
MKEITITKYQLEGLKEYMRVYQVDGIKFDLDTLSECLPFFDIREMRKEVKLDVGAKLRKFPIH